MLAIQCAELIEAQKDGRSYEEILVKIQKAADYAGISGSQIEIKLFFMATLPILYRKPRYKDITLILNIMKKIINVLSENNGSLPETFFEKSFICVQNCIIVGADNEDIKILAFDTIIRLCQLKEAKIILSHEKMLNSVSHFILLCLDEAKSATRSFSTRTIALDGINTMIELSDPSAVTKFLPGQLSSLLKVIISKLTHRSILAKSVSCCFSALLKIMNDDSKICTNFVNECSSEIENFLDKISVLSVHEYQNIRLEFAKGCLEVLTAGWRIFPNKRFYLLECILNEITSCEDGNLRADFLDFLDKNSDISKVIKERFRDFLEAFPGKMHFSSDSQKAMSLNVLTGYLNLSNLRLDHVIESRISFLIEGLLFLMGVESLSISSSENNLKVNFSHFDAAVVNDGFIGLFRRLVRFPLIFRELENNLSENNLKTEHISLCYHFVSVISFLDPSFKDFNQIVLESMLNCIDNSSDEIFLALCLHNIYISASYLDKISSIDINTLLPSLLRVLELSSSENETLSRSALKILDLMCIINQSDSLKNFINENLNFLINSVTFIMKNNSENLNSAFRIMGSVVEFSGYDASEYFGSIMELVIESYHDCLIEQRYETSCDILVYLRKLLSNFPAYKITVKRAKCENPVKKFYDMMSKDENHNPIGSNEKDDLLDRETNMANKLILDEISYSISISDISVRLFALRLAKIALSREHLSRPDAIHYMNNWWDQLVIILKEDTLSSNIAVLDLVQYSFMRLKSFISKRIVEELLPILYIKLKSCDKSPDLDLQNTKLAKRIIFFLTEFLKFCPVKPEKQIEMYENLYYLKKFSQLVTELHQFYRLLHPDLKSYLELEKRIF